MDMRYLVPPIIGLIISIVIIVGVWKAFVKAGKPGWAIFIPIYQWIVLLEIARKPIWWIILFCIPFVNIVIWIIVALDIAKNFGKESGFGVGLAILSPIFFPILGYGDARYRAA